MKTGYFRPGSALVLALLWLALSACGESRLPYAGTYRSLEPFADQGHIELILKDNGEATWTLGGRTTKFKWRVEGDRIWMYTKEGALVIVTVTEEGQKLSADITGEWHPGCPPEKCVYFRRVGPAR